jgi:hypothetical protein
LSLGVNEIFQVSLVDRVKITGNNDDLLHWS